MLMANSHTLKLDAWVAAGLFGAAFTSALWFKGFNTGFFGLSQSLLLVWVVLTLWRGYHTGIRLPVTGLSISLGVFWLWLVVSIPFSHIPSLSALNFWWIGSLPLTYWLVISHPDPERLWRSARWIVLAVALGLAALACYQGIVLKVEPTAIFLNRHSFGAMLNLVAIVVAAYFLVAPATRTSRSLWLIGIALFVLFFTIALMRGRGVIVSGLIGLILLAVLALRQAGWKRVVSLAAIVAIAFALGALPEQAEGLWQRMASLGSVEAASQPRWIIWRQAWTMLLDAPWWGTGLGTFSALWPAYRDPLDGSAGFYVHNDYLQLWIELGWPGLVLWLSVLSATLRVFLRAWKWMPMSAPQRIPMAGVFCALLAVAVHSFLDFNFYVMGILILCGLGLGLLQAWQQQARSQREWTLRPAGVLGERAFALVIVLLALFPLLYFLGLVLAEQHYQRGLADAERGAIDDADRAFTRAERLAPSLANVYMSHADLLRFVLSQSHAAEMPQRREVFASAQALIDRAEQLNPYRPDTMTVRAELYAQNPQLAPADQAAVYYRKALKLDPRHYPARLGLARLYWEAKQPAAALEVLRAGLDLVYGPDRNRLIYLGATADLAQKLGDRSTAERAAVLRQDLQCELNRQAAGCRSAPLSNATGTRPDSPSP